MKPRKFDYDRAAALWRSGKYTSLSALARELGVSGSSVGDALRRMGVLAPGSLQAVSPERATQVVRDMLADGTSEAETARVLAMSPRTVRKIVGRATRVLVPVAVRREKALAMKRQDQALAASACASAIGAHVTSVLNWWCDAGLAQDGPGRRTIPVTDPFAGLSLEYRDVDVSGEHQRVGLRRWALLPHRAATVTYQSSAGWMS